MIFTRFPFDRQLDIKDCGPACLKMVAKYYGSYYSLVELREKCGYSKEGVSLKGIAQGAETIGFRTMSVKATNVDLEKKIPLPCIVHWSNSHFIVVYKVSRNKVYVADPAKGIASYSMKDFVGGWYKKGENKGAALILEPQQNFEKRNENERRTRGKTFQNFLAYFKPYKTSLLNIFFIMLLVTGLQALLPFISKSIVDVGIHTNDMDFINILLIANIILIISITLSNSLRDWILLNLAARINISLISDYLIKLMSLPITFFENKMTGDILQRANDHERIRSFIMNNSLNLIFSGITFIIFSIILLTFYDFIFYVFAIGSVIYIIWSLSFLKLRKKLDYNYFELIAKNQSFWVETITGIQDIKLNNYERPKRWKWEGVQAKLFKVNNSMMSLNNVQNGGGQLIESCKNLVITFVCAKGVINGEISFGVMLSTQFMIGMLNGPVQQFIQFIISAQIAQISFLRLDEIRQLDNEETQLDHLSMPLPSDKSIYLKGISFQYNSNSPLIFKNLSIFIPAGKVTAIVGASGSGKSTLLKLLLRLYKPISGEISIGNMNVNSISLKDWRSKCGSVMQEGKIFNDTILANIVLGDEDVDFERLTKAVECANISSEISELPLGFQTIMGELGRGLSTGQKQRILIARALYKEPEYLFFDEATNSLDAINEEKIVSALQTVFTGKTVVVVAHRLSTIKSADQIIVMQGGNVVEVGTHDQLTKRNGKYMQLVKAQFDILKTN